MMNTLEKKIVLLLLFVITTVSAQVGVGTRTPHPDAMLEVASTNKGILLPRVALTSTTSVAPLSAHIEGMSVYNTATAGDVTPGYYYNDGSKWVKLATGAVPTDATGTSNGLIRLAGDLAGTAAAPSVKDGAITFSKLADNAVTADKITDGAVTVAKLNLGTANDGQVLKYNGTTWAPANDAGLTATTVSNAISSGVLTTTVNGVEATVTLPVPTDATDASNGIIRLAGDLAGTAAAPTVKDDAITNTKIANNAITNTKIGEAISIAKGGTGNDMTTTSGYVKQATAGAGFTTVSSIPVAEVTGAVQKVNGSTPDANGNVTVSFGTVYTGTLAAINSVVTNPNKGDIYVVSGDGIIENNGITSIYDGTEWQEITADQSSLDSRYLKLAGGTLAGSITVPTGNTITITDSPTAATAAANKSYVDTQLAAATPNATTTATGKIQLAGDLSGSATAPTITNLAVINKVLTGFTSGAGIISATDTVISAIQKLNGNDALKAPLSAPTFTGDAKAVTPAVADNDTSIATTAFVTTAVTNAAPNATDIATGKIQLAGDLAGTATAPLVKPLAITNAKIADNAITNTKIGEAISIAKGGTGNDMTLSSGYVYQATAGAGFTTVNTIPVAKVTGAVQKVNGSTPDTDGNVTVSFATVYTGTSAERGSVVTNPKKGDMYVVSGDGTTVNNGITFIYDGTDWKEITANQSSLDARYLKLAGGTLAGSITVPTGQTITITDSPTAATAAANKDYVDTQLAAAAPNATAILAGKIKLTGDLAGTYDVPEVAARAITTAKLAIAAVEEINIKDAAVTLAKIKTTGTADATTFLRGDATWVETASVLKGTELTNGTDSSFTISNTKITANSIVTVSYFNEANEIINHAITSVIDGSFKVQFAATPASGGKIFYTIVN